jgi:hypothetical protein
MTQDEIMEMARQAHFDSKTWVDIFADNPTVGDVRNYLIAFARLVAAKEREACAKLADEYATWGGSNFYDWFKKLAAAIRARGERA